MAQVRARRIFTSRRGRVQNGSTREVPRPVQDLVREYPSPAIETIQLPPHPDDDDDDDIEQHGSFDESAPDAGTAAEPSAVPAVQSVPTVPDYSKWTVTQLVAELKRRELPSSGSKPELVKRLEDADAGASS